VVVAAKSKWGGKCPKKSETPVRQVADKRRLFEKKNRIGARMGRGWGGQG